MSKHARDMTLGELHAAAFINDIRGRQLQTTQAWLGQLIEENIALGGKVNRTVLKAHTLLRFRKKCYDEEVAFAQRVHRALVKHGEVDLAVEFNKATGFSFDGKDNDA